VKSVRHGLPPLSITTQDSLSQLARLVLADGATWYDTRGALPGVPLPVEFYRSGAVAQVVAAINVGHGKGGFFVVYRPDGGYTARVVSADEFSTFMALFGLSAILVQ
jgi:hypothetical protein